MVKQVVEIFIACLLLILCAPIIAFIALLIRFESNGPILFKQIRMGQGFRHFYRYKFRTMVYVKSQNVDEARMDELQPFTQIGRILRIFKLDELPQLFNVVKGEMSLVGPRPELPYYVDKFREEYREILTIRPGLMDLAFLTYSDALPFVEGHVIKPQITEASYIKETLPEKIKLAKLYLEHASLLFDMAVIGQTFLNMLGLRSVLLKMSATQSSRKPGFLHESSAWNFLLTHRRILVVTFDLGLIVLANYLAFWLRFDGQIPEREYALFTEMLPWLLVIRGASFMIFSLNEGLWRYVSIWDVKKILVGVSLGTVVFYGIVAFALGVQSYPRSVFIIDSIVLIGFLVGMRLVVRLFRERKVLSQMKRVLIIGAGDVGAKIVREMQTQPSCSYAPLGFVDDDPNKWGKRIHGIKVLGSRQELDRILQTFEPEEVLVALPTATPAVVREITTTLEPFKLPIKTLPNLEDILDGKISINHIRALSITDLLQRPAVDLTPERVSRLIEGKRIFVTGAGGSIGSELCRQIRALSPKSLILYERHENSLYAIGSELSDKGQSAPVHLVLGDITDSQRLDDTIRAYEPDIIFHAAAHKHVPMMEENPGEAVKNNLLGTKLVAEAAVLHNVEHFVLISTDKAVNPSSVMGATKRGAELVIQAMAQQSSTCFLTVRFGNVLGSNGSVVPRFQDQIKAGGPVTVTHPEVRRYFMSIPEAVGLVLQTATLGEQGAIYLLEMGEQIKLVDLARNLIRLSGHLPEKEIAIKFVGLRPGEKLEEELVGKGELTTPSTIDKILKIKSGPSFGNSFLPSVQELAEKGNFNDHQTVLKQLQKIVPTFTPSKNIEQNGSSNGKAPDLQPTSEVTKRILLVDDDRKVRDAMRSCLESQGYSCAEADHGALALEWLETQHADLVITDNRMPVLGGLEFLGRLKWKDQSCPPHVMVLSGNLAKEDKEKVLKAGACAVFDKPGKFSEILPAIDRILKDA